MYLYTISIFTIIASFLFFLWGFVWGLFYIGELIEEYQSYSQKIISRLIFVVTLLHTLLIFDPLFPKAMLLIGIVSDSIYIQIVTTTFPAIRLASIKMGFSLILMIAHNVLLFTHLISGGRGLVEVIGYMLFFIWLIPMTFIVSFTTDQYTLPTNVEIKDGSKATRLPRKSYFTVAIRRFKEFLMPINWSSSQKRHY